jgi:hypothetical protein
VKAVVPWRTILRRDLWYLSVMYFCYGWVLWLYLTCAHVSGRSALVHAVADRHRHLPVAGGHREQRRGRLDLGQLSAHRAMGAAESAYPWQGFAVAAVALVPGVLADNVHRCSGWWWRLRAGADGGGLVGDAWISAQLSGSVSGADEYVRQSGRGLLGRRDRYLAEYLGWTSAFMVSSALCWWRRCSPRGSTPRDRPSNVRSVRLAGPWLEPDN